MRAATSAIRGVDLDTEHRQPARGEQPAGLAGAAADVEDAARAPARPGRRSAPPGSRAGTGRTSSATAPNDSARSRSVHLVVVRPARGLRISRQRRRPATVSSGGAGERIGSASVSGAAAAGERTAASRRDAAREQRPGRRRASCRRPAAVAGDAASTTLPNRRPLSTRGVGDDDQVSASGGADRRDQPARVARRRRRRRRWRAARRPGAAPGRRRRRTRRWSARPAPGRRGRRPARRRRRSASRSAATPVRPSTGRIRTRLPRGNGSRARTSAVSSASGSSTICGEPGRGGCDVAGKRARAAADVGDRQRPVRQRVEDVGEGLHVLEVEVGRVVEVDVGLPDPVDQQQPAAGAVDVGEQLDPRRRRGAGSARSHLTRRDGARRDPLVRDRRAAPGPDCASTRRRIATCRRRPTDPWSAARSRAATGSWTGSPAAACRRCTRAVDERLDRLVAVKVMSSALSADPAFTDRFAREARAAARLTHLNAVAVYDQGTERRGRAPRLPGDGAGRGPHAARPDPRARPARARPRPSRSWNRC